VIGRIAFARVWGGVTLLVFFWGSIKLLRLFEVRSRSFGSIECGVGLALIGSLLGQAEGRGSRHVSGTKDEQRMGIE